MRRRLFLPAALLAASLIAGCAVSPGSPDGAAPAPRQVRRTFSRSVAFRTAPTVMSGQVTAPPAKPATSRAASPSPWETYPGTLAAPTYTIARARAGGLPVAAVLGGHVVKALSSRTRVGAPRVALVVRDEGDWLQVLLPLRPNASLGWVRRSAVDLSSTALRVEIDRAAHRLLVFDGTALVMDEPAAVGRSRTPTPAGPFFVTELLQPPNPAGSYGPFAFTLSGYSPVYQRFGSGDGAIGIHGTNDPGSLGTDVSHGCIRISNDAVRRLAALLPLGAPVIIR